jgi:putative DNA primase/helicase
MVENHTRPMFNRVVLSHNFFPFTTRIPEEQQDKQLEEKTRGEASGILNWILEGTRRWTLERLTTPRIILSATEEYRGETDVIGNFIRERCVQETGAAIF